MLLTPDEKTLYVALSNSDLVAAVATATAELSNFFSTTAPVQKYAGSYPTALARSSDGKYLVRGRLVFGRDCRLRPDAASRHVERSNLAAADGFHPD